MNKKSEPVVSTIDFASLIDWYVAQCDGTWEHQYGLKLETLDNPGWLLTIDLIHTDLQGWRMPELREGCGPDANPVSPRWIHCAVQDNQFKAACDPTQIARLFQVFHEFRLSQATRSGSNQATAAGGTARKS